MGNLARFGPVDHVCGVIPPVASEAHVAENRGRPDASLRWKLAVMISNRPTSEGEKRGAVFASLLSETVTTVNGTIR